jgi:Flp pilus assembly protein TadB
MSPSSPETGEDAGSITTALDAWFLFGALVAILIAFIVGLLLIQAVRRRRLRRRPTTPAATLPDPWSESARRLKP